ncbi:hypothetical protein ACRC7T_01235 [Segnochrobactraceae bacterium EtOH-i3]
MHQSLARSLRPVRLFLAANPLLRYLAINWIAGAVASAIVVGGILAFDIVGMRTLIGSVQEPVLPVLLLVFGFLVTLTSVAMATAIMQLGRKDQEPGGRMKAPVVTRIPVPVQAAARGGRTRG